MSSSPARIEEDIERTRDHLVDTLDEIADRVSPTKVAQRSAKGLKAWFVDEYGQLKLKPLVAMGTAATFLLGLLTWRKRRHGDG